MIKCAAYLENNYGLDTEFIGRRGLDRVDSFTLEMTGKFLAYHVQIDGGWVNLRLQLMDEAKVPELIVTVADGPPGWKKINNLMRRLEEEEIKSLQRPIQIGDIGPDGLVISCKSNWQPQTWSILLIKNSLDDSGRTPIILATSK